MFYATCNLRADRNMIPQKAISIISSLYEASFAGCSSSCHPSSIIGCMDHQLGWGVLGEHTHISNVKSQATFIFKILLRLTSLKTSNSDLLAFCESQLVTGEFPSQRANNKFPCHRRHDFQPAMWNMISPRRQISKPIMSTLFWALFKEEIIT